MVLFFVGGVHGAGKSTICRLIAPEIGAVHLVAGELIKNARSSTPLHDKGVKDPNSNQDHLLTALAKFQDKRVLLLLDGHFCLLRSDHSVTEIPIDVFASIRPVAMVLVDADPITIHSRLRERDGSDYSLKSISELVARERAHAQEVSLTLSLPLLIVKPETPAAEVVQFLSAQA